MSPTNISSAKSEVWGLLESGPCGAEHNMAVDARLLETAAQRRFPLLRFYGWTEPAASYGYSQRIEEAQRLTPLRPLVGRPTGGGVVPHDADWTYSVTFPPGHWWFASSARESYQRVHEWIQESFSRLQISTELSPSCMDRQRGQCFVGAERSDLLWHGRKIAGAAQRRNRQGLLIQGSIQPAGIAVPRSAWEQSMCAAAAERWNVKWLVWNPKASPGVA